MTTLNQQLDALAESYEDRITLANAHTQLRLLAIEAAQLATAEMQRIIIGADAE